MVGLKGSPPLSKELLVLVTSGVISYSVDAPAGEASRVTAGGRERLVIPLQHPLSPAPN